jgi:hypothetical protein
LKGSWRDDARILEKLHPEDFGPSRNQPSEIDGSKVEPQSVANAPESPQSVPAALQAPSPTPLASVFWQALLYGSPDALLSPRDANTALRLVARELSVEASVFGELSESIRVNTLRKMLGERFGAKVWDCVNKLWRAAPASPGAPVPNEDQSQASPGVRDCLRSMPAWRREFHPKISNQQRLLEGIGGWGG